MEKEDIIVMNVPLKFVNQRIEDYAMQVTYDPKEDRGQVVYNLSVIRTADLNKAVRVIKDVCRSGICASTMIRFEHSGARIEDYVIPEGMTGLMTICSTTLDGLLLNRGVPMNPVGGGVVEVEERVPRRFTHLIRYEYTTIDPLQVLISQEITSITRVMKSGNGNILANIRECHMEAEPILAGLLEDLSGAAFTGILDVGLPNTPALGVTVDPQYFGVVALGGTNQMAALVENGIWVKIRAMKGLVDIATMQDVLTY
jgi:repressor of nif and glnA expression